MTSAGWTTSACSEMRSGMRSLNGSFPMVLLAVCCLAIRDRLLHFLCDDLVGELAVVVGPVACRGVGRDGSPLRRALRELHVLANLRLEGDFGELGADLLDDLFAVAGPAV